MDPLDAQKLKAPLNFARAIWAAIFFSGFMFTLILPPTVLEMEIRVALLLAAFALVMLAFAAPALVEKYSGRKVVANTPGYLENFRQVFVTSRIMSFAFVESALLVSLIASGADIETLRIYLLMGFGMLMGTFFPTRVSAEHSLRRMLKASA